MIECYLEQQQDMAAALLSAEVRRSACEIDTVDTANSTDAENIVKLLTSMKKATTVLCDESQPAVSLIVLLKHMVQKSMAQRNEDLNTITQMTEAILKERADWYQWEEEEFLQESRALDSWFQALPWLNDSEREEVKATRMQIKVFILIFLVCVYVCLYVCVSNLN